MKTLKTLVFAVATGMALLIFAGAGVAQASTSLYTDAAKTIPYPAGTVVDLSLKSGTTTNLKTTGGESLATCSGSTAKGKTATESGEAISTSLETLSWSGCSTTTDTLATGSLEIKWTSGTSGEVTGKNTEWTVNIFGVSCTYGFGEGTKLGTFAGGEAPALKVEAAVKKTAGGFLCPETTTFAAEYAFTEPHAIYVGSGVKTTLYTDAAKTIPYPAGTVVDLSLKAGTTTRLTHAEGETFMTCTGSIAAGQTSNETGDAVSLAIATLTWSGCSQTVDTVANGSLEIKWISSGGGEVIAKGSQWTFSIFGSSCTYGFGEGTKLGTITGGSKPVLEIESAIKKTAGGFLCSEKATFDAEYVFTEPHAIFVGH